VVVGACLRTEAVGNPQLTVPRVQRTRRPAPMLPAIFAAAILLAFVAPRPGIALNCGALLSLCGPRLQGVVRDGPPGATRYSNRRFTTPTRELLATRHRRNRGVVQVQGASDTLSASWRLRRTAGAPG
jgi:hypothetical protein